MVSSGPMPRIYYDRIHIFHPTTPRGCRYACNFTNSMNELGKGDVSVYSDHFAVSMTNNLRQNGVIVAFESGESTVHMPRLTSHEIEMVK